MPFFSFSCHHPLSLTDTHTCKHTHSLLISSCLFCTLSHFCPSTLPLVAPFGILVRNRSNDDRLVSHSGINQIGSVFAFRSKTKCDRCLLDALKAGCVIEQFIGIQTKSLPASCTCCMYKGCKADRSPETKA